MIREVPVPIAAPPIQDIEESVASLDDEYIPRPPPPKSRLSLRDEAPEDDSPPIMPVPLGGGMVVARPDPERFEEESRKARMMEVEIGPLKEKIILLTNHEEKRALSPQERKELGDLLHEY